MKDVLKLAREAGFDCAPDGHIYTDSINGVCDEELERFATLVAAAERGACAEVCYRIAALIGDPIDQERIFQCATAIRARGETK